MALTPEARGEIVEEAKRRALKDMGKPESELASEEKRQAGSLANDYAVQMLKEAHDFKLRLADLDADKYAFEKVFAEDLQNTPYAQNLNDDANLEEDFSSQVDENAILKDAEIVAQKFSKKVPTKRYLDLDDFLKNGINKSESTFFDFGKLSPQAVERIKNDTGVDLNGYVHTLQGYGILHGESRHSSQNESLSGQVPITREDWKLADKIVNEFDKVVKSPKISKNQNEVLIFRKKIGDEIYYVAEARTGRKKLVSATMYKHKAKKEGPLQPEYPSQATRSRPKPSLDPSLNSEQSENFSENQEENAKHSKNFDENAENADLGGDLPQGKGAPLVFKPILKPKLPLPKRFREGKVAGIGDIRRWVSEAMGINVNLEADAGADYNGVYTTPSDTIHLRGDNINSLRVLFHELGHSIEKRFFNDYFSDNPNSEAGRELFDYFKKQANAKAYKKSDYVGEGFAEFIKEFVLNPASAAKEFPKTTKLFSAALENHADLNEILDKTRQMVDRYQNASSKEKAQARIQSSDKEKTKVFLRERPLKIYNWLTRHFTDKSARLADLQRIVNKLAGEGTADFDTLRRAIVQGGGNGQTEFSLAQKQLDLKGRIVGKSYADILNPVESRLDDFRLFVVSRRMVNLMQKNGYLKDGKYRAGANDFCVEKSGFTVNGILEFSTFSGGFFNSSYLTIPKRFAIFQEIWI